MDVVRSAAAGAAMCHLHCRWPDGSLTPDITEMADTFDRIAERTDLIIQASTGGISDMDISPKHYSSLEDYWEVVYITASPEWRISGTVKSRKARGASYL